MNFIKNKKLNTLLKDLDIKEIRAQDISGLEKVKTICELVYKGGGS